MASAAAGEWVAAHLQDPAAAMRAALAVFRLRGWTAADLDYLLYEGQFEDSLRDDLEFQAALDTLSRLREAGVVVA